MHGINFLVLAIGIYGIGEILWTIETSGGKLNVSQATVSVKRIIGCLKDLKGTFKSMPWARCWVLRGHPAGGGATPGSLMAYGVPRACRRIRVFRQGQPRGRHAPESANNAASTGSMLPMLTLGIPARRPRRSCSAAW